MNETIKPSTEGYVYILFDAERDLIKIGCTKNGNRQRQKAIMSAHPSKLVNVLNVKVPDRFAAESQCHRHFKHQRTSGEWFKTHLCDALIYFHEELDHMEMDFEHLGVVAHAIITAKAAKTSPFGRKRKGVNKTETGEITA